MSRAFAILLAAALLAITAIQPVLAQGGVTEAVFGRLERIHELIAEDRNAEALVKTNELAGRSLNDNERALVERTFGSIYINLDRYPDAITHFESSIAVGSLPIEAQQGVLYSLAGLYASLQRWPDVIETVGRWLENEDNPVGDAFVMLGQAHARLGRHREAVPLIEKAIAISRKPSESWYQLLASEHFQLNDYGSAAEVLNTTIALWPDRRQYWTLLTGCYQRLDQHVRAMSVLELGYRKGVLVEEKDIVTIAQMGLANGVPFRVGQLLEKEMAAGRVERNKDNLETLKIAWTRSREYDRGVRVLRELSGITGNGTYLAEAVKLLYEFHRWQDVVDTGRDAIDTGTLDNPGQVLLFVGIAQTELREFEAARESFIEASRFEGVTKTARAWLGFVDDQLSPGQPDDKTG